MTDRDQTLARVAAEAHRVFGDRATDWMTRPNRHLDGMSPADLLASRNGARVVLRELKQASLPLGAKPARRS